MTPRGPSSCRRSARPHSRCAAPSAISRVEPTWPLSAAAEVRAGSHGSMRAARRDCLPGPPNPLTSKRSGFRFEAVGAVHPVTARLPGWNERSAVGAAGGRDRRERRSRSGAAIPWGTGRTSASPWPARTHLSESHKWRASPTTDLLLQVPPCLPRVAGRSPTAARCSLRERNAGAARVAGGAAASP